MVQNEKKWDILKNKRHSKERKIDCHGVDVVVVVVVVVVTS